MREINYDQDSTALQLASAAIGTHDPDRIAERSGAFYMRETQEWRLLYMGQRITVARDGGSIQSHRYITKTERLLILHYLMKAGGSPVKNEMIAFRDIPMGGALYAPTFQSRAIDQICAAFGAHPAQITRHMAALGGTPAHIGDASVTLPVLPRLPIHFVVWAGDEEVPPSANILFDVSISDYLPVEDVVMLGSIAGYALIDGPSGIKHA